jgi:hypothetical protein
MCATSSRFEPAPPNIEISECQVFKQTKTREMFEDFNAFSLHMTQATKYNLPTVMLLLG